LEAHPFKIWYLKYHAKSYENKTNLLVKLTSPNSHIFGFDERSSQLQVSHVLISLFHSGVLVEAIESQEAAPLSRFSEMEIAFCDKTETTAGRISHFRSFSTNQNAVIKKTTYFPNYFGNSFEVFSINVFRTFLGMRVTVPSILIEIK